MRRLARKFAAPVTVQDLAARNLRRGLDFAVNRYRSGKMDMQNRARALMSTSSSLSACKRYRRVASAIRRMKEVLQMFNRLRLALRVLSRRENSLIIIPLSAPWSVDYFGTVADAWTEYITQSEGMRPSDAPMILL